MTKPIEQTLPEALEYRDGRLYWREGWPCATVGQEAGYTEKRDGYIRVSHRGILFLAHRIVWLLHNGSWPSGEIDHINGDKSDNRIENLRDVSKRENMYNRPMYKCNKTGYKGVSIDKRSGKYQVSIRKDGVVYWIGYFACPIKGAKAYDRKAIELHGEHARTNFPSSDYESG